MKQRKGFEDDGRVIANMNIEGTPWYVAEENKDRASEKVHTTATPTTTPTRKETFHLITGALTAGLMIGFVFILAFLVFILFCTKIWLK